MSITCTFNRPIPAMHFPKDSSLARNQSFITRHFKDLNSQMPSGSRENRYFYFLKDTFSDFITTNVQKAGVVYFRLYFACIDNKLDIIYATNDPAAGGSAELYWRFMQNPDAVQSRFIPIPKGDAGTPDTAAFFVKQYNDIKAPVIKNTTGVDATQSMIYDVKNIIEMMNEIDEQNPKGLKVYFSAYPHDEARDDRRDRLFFNFVMTSDDENTGLEEDIYIDDCSNFPERQVLSTEQQLLSGDQSPVSVLRFFDYDNGTMCPPDKGCIGTPLNP